MAYADKEDLDILQNKVDEHSNKLAQCRLEDHLRDHDTITVMTEKQTYMGEKLKRVSETQVNMINQLNESSGNLNILAGNVADINKDRNTRNKTVTAIFVGVVITVLSGLLMLWVTYTISSVNSKTVESNEKQMEVIIEKLNVIEQNEKP